MRAMLIDQRFIGAFIRTRFQPLRHAAYVFYGIPQSIVLSADKYDLSSDILDFDLLGFLHGMQALRFIKHLSGGDQIAAHFGFFFDFLPLVAPGTPSLWPRSSSCCPHRPSVSGFLCILLSVYVSLQIPLFL